VIFFNELKPIIRSNKMQNSKVWDLPLRVFHWLLVISFFVAYLTEEDWLNIHTWAGYTVGGLLIFRLIWGFIGNKYARFSHFMCSPKESIEYVKSLLASNAKRYQGHNPAGAAMVILLLIALLFTVVSGIAVYGADQNAGLLSFIDKDNEEFWEELHEFFANFTLLLVVMHVIGVAVESKIHKESLVKSMFNGYKKSQNIDEIEGSENLK
jgi:cytochrome b